MKASASATAMLVARGVAFHADDPLVSHLIEQPELWRRMVMAGGGRLLSARSPLHRLLVRIQERLTVPGLTLHYVLRKREIERLVRAAIADGYEHLVVLGAGLDTLATRLRDEIRVTEIDHPATQMLKRDVAPDLEYVPIDFTTETAGDALSRCIGGRAIVVAEAVFLYLDELEVRRLLRALPRPVRLIFTFFEPRRRGAINFQNATRLADLWLQWKGEPARWAIAPSQMAAFVAQEGFVLRDLRLDHQYHDAHGPLARGEHIAVVEAS